MTPHPKRRRSAWQLEPDNVPRSVAISCSTKPLPQSRDGSILPRTDYVCTRTLALLNHVNRNYARTSVSSSWVMDIGTHDSQQVVSLGGVQSKEDRTIRNHHRAVAIRLRRDQTAFSCALIY